MEEVPGVLKEGLIVPVQGRRQDPANVHVSSYREIALACINYCEAIGEAGEPLLVERGILINLPIGRKSL